jgi:hypothetical protein
VNLHGHCCENLISNVIVIPCNIQVSPSIGREYVYSISCFLYESYVKCNSTVKSLQKHYSESCW